MGGIGAGATVCKAINRTALGFDFQALRSGASRGAAAAAAATSAPASRGCCAGFRNVTALQNAAVVKHSNWMLY